MHARLLAESLRHALFHAVVLVDADASPDEATTELFERYTRAVQVSGKEQVARKIGLTVAEMNEHFGPRLRRAVQERRKTGASPAVQSIAQLRLLIWIEIILRRGPQPRNVALLESQQPEVLARKQVRALELVLRALINEHYRSQDALIERLRLLFKNPVVDKWLATAEPGDVLTGTLFSELASIFVHRSEWDKYASIYSGADCLRYLRDNRETVQAFLDDVRIIRNDVAHHKQLSGVQVELLNLYYTELVEPVQTLYDSGRSKINPDSILNVDTSTLEHYLATAQKDLDDIGKKTQEIARDLSEVNRGVKQVEIRTLGLDRKVWALIVMATCFILALVFGAAFVRNWLIHDYHSTGWVALSTSGASDTAFLDVTARIFKSDTNAQFDRVALTGSVRSDDGMLTELNLTRSLKGQLTGSEQTIEFKVPKFTKRLKICETSPNTYSNDLFRVTQEFIVESKNETTEINPVGEIKVAKEVHAPCDVE